MRQTSMSRNRKRRHRGAVLVEYALLLTFFALPVMAGFTAAGVALLRNYRATRATILQPFP